MISDLQQAAAVVREMHDLGAVFSVVDAGRWSWEPQPEIMRGAIRRYWQSLDVPPNDLAMVRAILRSVREASHA